MSTHKRFEIGVDYEGVSKRHLQVNEEIIFSNEEASRIFMPECGSFYVDSLSIKDNASGRELKIGIDYDVFILDSKATKKSGKQVCSLIIVKDTSSRGVLLNYQFVGGSHTTGYHALEQLLKMYPSGTSAIISFDEVLNKPSEFNPAYHTQHVSEFYKADGLLVWLERVRQAIHNRQNNNLEKMYQQAQTSIDGLFTKLNNTNTRLSAELDAIFASIKVQSDEYIYTDSSENPAVKRGYGNWSLVTNTILRGGPAGDFLIGSGSIIAMGSDQVIRNCYIWYNKQDSVVNEAKVTLTSNKDTISEGETITFTLNTVNIPNNTKIEWFLDGIDDKDIQSNAAGKGTVTITNGTATINLTAAKDRKTEGNESFTMRLRDYPLVSKSFTVLDTSQDRRITAVKFLNTSNLAVETITEDSKFKLRISTTGLIGQTIYLKWSADAKYLTASPPTSVVVTANNTDIALEIIGNLATNPTRILEVTVLEESAEVIDATTPKATVYILDTSQELLANIVFLNDTNLIVTNIDEDSEFAIQIRTNGGVGQKLKLSYKAARPLSEFTGLVNEVTIGAGNQVSFSAKHVANYITATTTEFLEVTVTSVASNQVLAVKTLLLNDTTKNPNFIVNMSKQNTGMGNIATINEGEDFYLVFKVPGWVGSVTPPFIDITLSMTGSPSMAARVTVPSKLTNVRFDDKNAIDRIEWLNGDTLALRMSAIADKAIHGNAKLKVKWKMSLASTYVDGPEIDIIDTSRPTMSASWSSSSTELTAITSVDEMKTNGTDNTCYLFLDIDGDGSTFTNVKIDLSNSTANMTDLITVFPQAVSIAKGVNRKVIRFDILSDFITEGNETLAVKVTADGFTGVLVLATLTIVDNSVRIPITFTRPASTMLTGSNYSEWENVTVTINLQPLAFATTLVITETNAAKVDGLTAGSYNIPANQASYTITMSAKKIRHENGNYSVGITAKRMFGTKTISSEASLTTNFTNDRTFPKIKALNIYSNSAGTTLATKLSEGLTYWAKVTVEKPTAGMLVVIGNGLDGFNDVGTKAGTKRFIFANNRKVVLKPAEVNGEVSTALIEFTLPFDRATNPVGLQLELAAKIDWSAANKSLAVGASYTQSLTANNTDERATTKLIAVEDLSKTLSITGRTSTATGGNAVTTFNEGDPIVYIFTLINPTVGDVYELVLDSNSGVKTNRFTTHEFSSRDITITNRSTQILTFNSRTFANYITDGNKTGNVTLRNKTLGVNEASLSFTLLDTTQTPTISAVWLNSANDITTSVDEGVSFSLRITTTNLNLNDISQQISITNPVGRPLSEFDSYVMDYNTPPLSNGTATFRYRLKENFKVDTLNTFAATVSVIGLPSHVAKVSASTPTLIINDTSRSKQLTLTWFNGITTVNSVNEGGGVDLEVECRGYPDKAAVSVTLTGAGLTAADIVGGQLTKTSSLQPLSTTGKMFARISWAFSNDLLTEGDETVTATVKIDGVVVGTTTLIINDTSVTLPTYDIYLSSNVNGTNRITTANEGDTVYVIIDAANLRQNNNATWKVYGSTGGGTGDGVFSPFEPMSGSTTIKNGRTVLTLKIPINYITTGNMRSAIGFSIPGEVNNVLTQYIDIIDTYKVPSFQGLIWSKNQEGTSPVTTLNPGEIIYLVILTKYIQLNQQFELSYSMVDGLVLADWEYGPHTGTKMETISTYNASTGDGRRAIAFKVK